MDINKFSPMSGRVVGEDGKVYNIVDLLQKGGQGMEFLFGTGSPDDGDGDNGDVYMNTDNGDVYKKESGSWTKKGNLEGPKGEQGPEGEQGPKGDPGGDGVGIADIYIENDEIVFELTDNTEKRFNWPPQQ